MTLLDPDLARGILEHALRRGHRDGVCPYVDVIELVASGSVRLRRADHICCCVGEFNFCGCDNSA